MLRGIWNFRGWQRIRINFEVWYKIGFFRADHPPPLREWKGSLITEQFSVVRWLNAGTSLSPSIVNIWAQKNGSFSGKCCPGLTRDFITPCSWHWQQCHVWRWKPPRQFRSQEIESKQILFPTLSILTRTGSQMCIWSCCWVNM